MFEFYMMISQEYNKGITRGNQLASYWCCQEAEEFA
jgi:hypothetical protein